MFFSYYRLRLRIMRIMVGIPLITFCYSCAVVKTLTSQEEFEQLDSSRKPFILKFFSKTCPVCIAIEEQFENVSQEDAFKNIAFAKLDIDSPQGDAIAKRYNSMGLKIFGVPTFVYKKDKDTIDYTVGVENAARFEEDLRKKLKDYFGAIGLEVEGSMAEESLREEEIKPEISIEVVEEELAVPAPEEKEAPSQPQEARGIGAQLWTSLVSFFSFFIKKLQELLTYIIDMIRKLFGGR